MQLRRSTTIIWRWSWLLILGALLAAVAAYGFSASRPATYRATATVFINHSEEFASPSYNDILANQQIVKTYGQLVKSADIVTPVAETFEMSDAQIRAALSAQPRQDTQLLDVSATNRDAETAANIANEAAKALVRRIQESQLAPQTLIENDLETQSAALQRLLEAQTQTAARLSRPQPGLSDDQRLVQLAETQSQASATRQQQADINRRLSDLRIAVAKMSSDIQVVDAALTPTRPIGLSTTLTTTLGAVLGVLAAGAVAAVAEHLKPASLDPDAVVRATGAPLIGAIPTAGWGRRSIRERLGPRFRRRPKRLLLANTKASESLWEAFRKLRMNLEFVRSGRRGSAPARVPSTLLVTSVADGEGKSTTAANLAVVLTRAGRRVVLIDADLRRPSLHDFFGLSNEVGLSSVLNDTGPDGDIPLQPVPVGHPGYLALLPSGSVSHDSDGILASAKMARVMASLRNEADVVLIDGPSLSDDDGQVLAHYADGVLLIVDATQSRVGTLGEGAALLLRTHTPIVGVVLNKFDVHDAAHYGERELSERAADDWADTPWPSLPVVRTLERDGPAQQDAAVDRWDARPQPGRTAWR